MGRRRRYDSKRADYVYYLKRAGAEKETPDHVAKLGCAKGDYEAARRRAVDAMSRTRASKERVVADASCCLAAVHAELFGVSADYVGEASDALPLRPADKTRTRVKRSIAVGGPAVAARQWTRTGKALAVATGKRTPGNIRKEQAAAAKQKRLQASLAKCVLSDGSPKTHLADGVGGAPLTARAGRTGSDRTGGRAPVKSEKSARALAAAATAAADAAPVYVALFDCVPRGPRGIYSRMKEAGHGSLGIDGNRVF